MKKTKILIFDLLKVGTVPDFAKFSGQILSADKARHGLRWLIFDGHGVKVHNGADHQAFVRFQKFSVQYELV